jgi:hypothetical protein
MEAMHLTGVTIYLRTRMVHQLSHLLITSTTLKFGESLQIKITSIRIQSLALLLMIRHLVNHKVMTLPTPAKIAGNLSNLFGKNSLGSGTLP